MFHTARFHTSCTLTLKTSFQHMSKYIHQYAMQEQSMAKGSYHLLLRCKHDNENNQSRYNQYRTNKTMSGRKHICNSTGRREQENKNCQAQQITVHDTEAVLSISRTYLSLTVSITNSFCVPHRP